MFFNLQNVYTPKHYFLLWQENMKCPSWIHWILWREYQTPVNSLQYTCIGLLFQLILWFAGQVASKYTCKKNPYISMLYILNQMHCTSGVTDNCICTFWTNTWFNFICSGTQRLHKIWVFTPRTITPFHISQIIQFPCLWLPCVRWCCTQYLNSDTAQNCYPQRVVQENYLLNTLWVFRTLSKWQYPQRIVVIW